MPRLKSEGDRLLAVVIITALYMTTPALAGLAQGGGGSAGVMQAVPSPDPPTPVTTYPLNATSAYPLGVTTDAAGNVWFAQDNFDSLVEYVTSNSTMRSFAIPTPLHLAWVWFMVFDRAGVLWFSDESQQLIWSFDPATRVFANYTAGTAYPMVLNYDAVRSRIWFTSLKTGQVGYFDIAGERAVLGAVVNMSAPSPGPGVSGIAVDSAGDAYVAESFQAKIVEVDGNSLATVKTWDLPPGSQPVGLALDPTRGRLWFTNHASSFFGYVNLNSTGFKEYPTSLYFTGGAYAITLPYWISVSASGYVWFNEHIANRIGRFDPSTLQLTEFDVPTNASSPLMLSLDGARGVVWFTEFAGNAIASVDQNASLGTEVTVAPRVATAGPTATVTSTATPRSASPTVSVWVGSTGEPQPGFEVTSSSKGSGYEIGLTDYQAGAGNYTAAVCYAYGPVNQCGYLTVVVPSTSSTLLFLYAIYGAVAVGVAGLALALLWGRRAARLRARPA